MREINMSDFTLDQLKQHSLNDIENYYKQGRISEELVNEYLNLWNCTKGRFTKATLRDGSIRQEEK